MRDVLAAYSKKYLWKAFLSLIPFNAGQAQFSPYNFEALKEEFAKTQDDPLLLSADAVSYEQEETLFHAKGNVLLQQSGYRLCTDALTYDTEKHNVFLPKPFRIEDSTGDIFRGDSGCFLHQMREGKIQGGNLLTHTRERMVANHVHKKNKITEFTMGSYSPCERCEDQLEPTWALYARRIVKDDEEHTMQFTDTHLAFLGVPIVYAPYFYFPTKRKSGFLLPYGSATKELGFYLGTPYYWVINSSGDNDLLVTPFVTTNGGIMLASEYRHRLNNGLVKLKGAVNGTQEQTYPSDTFQTVTVPATRGYVNADIAYNLTPAWRLRSDEWWTSDKTFLSTRPFFGETTSPYLESRTQIEGLYTRHYANIEGIRYQGMQDNDSPQTTPYIYPRAIYSYVTPNLIGGSYALVNAETLSMYQQVGTHMQRGTLDGWWFYPIHTAYGHIVTPFAHVEGALYRAQRQDLDAMLATGKTRNTQRLFPQGGINWRFPIATTTTPLFIVTPIVQGIMGAFHVNKVSIPDEDSLGVTFNDSVLFQANRFPGHDRVDDGARANYAMSMQMFLPSGQSAQLLFGQSYSFSEPPASILPFGVRKGASDYVGRVETTFQNPMVNVRYRFRFDQKTFSSTYQEVGAVVGPTLFRVSTGYVSSTSIFPFYKQPCNQLFLEINSQFLKFWSTKVFVTQNFKTSMEPKKLLDKGIGLTYHDECLAFNLTVQHSFYRMRDLKPGITVDFSLQLKNLGGFRQKLDRFARRSDLEPVDQ